MLVCATRIESVGLLLLIYFFSFSLFSLHFFPAFFSTPFRSMQKQFVVVDKHSSVPTENDFIAQTAVAEKSGQTVGAGRCRLRV